MKIIKSILFLKIKNIFLFHKLEHNNRNETQEIKICNKLNIQMKNFVLKSIGPIVFPFVEEIE